MRQALVSDAGVTHTQPGMERRTIKSSSIREVGYDAETGQLEVEFTDGTIYLYDLVPRRVFKELLRAQSAGRYFGEKIRDRYTAKRLR